MSHRLGGALFYGGLLICGVGLVVNAHPALILGGLAIVIIGAAMAGKGGPNEPPDQGGWG
ncbi:MAG: hypothetical protein UW86_C0003G0019 [Microgenomates group bacterium GW2011_GWA1_Microgenomates_45_10]|nr:MAG: hypothetical protein UW69_C0034G0009 [Microgenomates group bacterium GW2011_GWA2_44_7]KKT77651.1 MAG: hypothetical protein UW73_C0015G0019 [Microgenomates group bacterium GW2011_GWB1_44_8]KKT87374.1 MAG: hypothetical protein UW86_C0003G0019 [Microgenomates group bacterium GW2011_GWA1_Microgenomates_45_10]